MIETMIQRGGIENLTGESSLALAIITMGVDDVKRGKLWAREWFYSDAFTFWLAAIGGDLDPDTLRNGILTHFGAGGHDTSRGQRTMQAEVLGALRENPDAPATELARQLGVTPSTIRKYRALMRSGQLP